MLVDACRACGIPARVAGIFSWREEVNGEKHKDGGNHVWVEVWSEGRWHYLGAAEPDKLDQAWFTERVRGTAVVPQSPLHRICAASFRRTGMPFLLP